MLKRPRTPSSAAVAAFEDSSASDGRSGDPADVPLTEGDGAQRLAGDSLSVAGWTIVSRATGFARVAMVGAVLGPTYLGNTFLAANSLPNVTFQLLGGYLIGTLLVPALVESFDRDGEEASRRLAQGFVGVSVAVFLGVAVVGIAAAPLLLRVLTLSVDQSGVADDQLRIGWPLLALLMFQVPLYGLAFSGTAVMNSRGRFALAAGAPAAENIGVMVTLGVVAVLFGTEKNIHDVPTAEVLVLGLGATGAVALHAGLQCWGAHSVGVDLIPRFGWRESHVRELLVRAKSSLWQATLDALRFFGTLVVANGVSGGVVAFSLAINFYYLPLALGARPVAQAFLPRLSRLARRETLAGFHDQYRRGIATALFLTMPAAVAYLLLAFPLARAASFGDMANPHAVELAAVSLAALAAGLVAESWLLMAIHASYARKDARAPLIATWVRTLVTAVGFAVALAIGGRTSMLIAVGLAVSAGNLAGAILLGSRVRLSLPASVERLTPAITRTLAASLIMSGPAYLLATAVGGWLGGDLRYTIALLLAAALGGITYVGLQRLWGSPELAFFSGGVRGLKARFSTPNA